MAYATIGSRAQVADVTLPKLDVSCSVTTNSPATQKVTFVSDGKEVYSFEGSGERQLIGSFKYNLGSPLRIEAQYQLVPSQLHQYWMQA